MRLVPPQSMPRFPGAGYGPTIPARPAPAAVATVDPTTSALAELRKLGDLRAQGVIDEAEFATLKARILDD